MQVWNLLDNSKSAGSLAALLALSWPALPTLGVYLLQGRLAPDKWNSFYLFFSLGWVLPWHSLAALVRSAVFMY